MSKLDLELSEAMIKDLTSIGLDVVLKEYFKNLEELAKDSGEPWDDERMDTIGQNGNDGLHYRDYGAGPIGLHHNIYDDKEGM